MNIIKKLYRKIFPRKFTHNPEDFMIKPVVSWFSNQWYQIKYSANKGESWKFLYEVREPLFDYSYEVLLKYDWEWDRMSFKPSSKSFKNYSNEFKCYQDILDFYSKEEERMKIGKIKRQSILKQYQEQFNKNLHGT